MSRLTEKDIAVLLAKRMKTDEKTAAQWLDAVTETLYSSLSTGTPVTIRNFGNFFVQARGSSAAFKFNPSQRLRAALGWSNTYKGSR
jgi:nucleoid DNA-binding protein